LGRSRARRARRVLQAVRREKRRIQCSVLWAGLSRRVRPRRWRGGVTDSAGSPTGPILLPGPPQSAARALLSSYALTDYGHCRFLVQVDSRLLGPRMQHTHLALSWSPRVPGGSESLDWLS